MTGKHTRTDDAPDGVLAASVAMGLEVLDELMATEVTELAGPKGKARSGRTHVRHGSDQI